MFLLTFDFLLYDDSISHRTVYYFDRFDTKMGSFFETVNLDVVLRKIADFA